MNNTIQFFNCWVLDKIKDKFVHYIDISITSQDSFPTYKAAFYPKIRHWIFLYRDRVKFNAMNSETGGLFTSIMQKHYEQNYKSHFDIDPSPVRTKFKKRLKQIYSKLINLLKKVDIMSIFILPNGKCACMKNGLVNLL